MSGAEQRGPNGAPAAGRPRRAARAAWRAVCLGLGWLLASGLAAAPARAEATARAEPPAITAQAATVVDGQSGRRLYARRAHLRLPPASLTKMVTAMVARQRAAPDRIVRATERSLVEPSVIGLEPGDALPLGVILHGLLLNSGNDAALAIAETLGEGSIPRFVAWMNALSDSLGLRDSHFANPHGLDEGLHYASAHDLAVIGRALLRDQTLGEIVRRQRYEFDGPPLWVFHNTNPLLPTYEGLDGLKTGYETRAGRCLAASATRDGRQVVVVVLNSERPADDAAALLDYGFALLAAAAPEQRGQAEPAPFPPGLLAGLDPAPRRLGERDDLPGRHGGVWRPRDSSLRLAAQPRSVYDLLRSGSARSTRWQ